MRPLAAQQKQAVKPVQLAAGWLIELLAIGWGVIPLPGRGWDATHARNIRIQRSLRHAERPESPLLAVSRKAWNVLAE